MLLGDTTSTAAALSYPDPGVSVGGYNATQSGQATHNAFMAEARKQSRAYWRDQYTALAVNAYVRAAFGLTTN